MKNKVWNIVKIILLSILFPFLFIKIFVGIGHLPNQDGDIVEVVFRHSMFENICDGAYPFLAYAVMAAMIFAIALNVANLKVSNVKLKIVSDIVFGISIGSFFVLLLYASTVTRGY